MRAAARKLFGMFFILLGAGAAAVLAPVGVLWVFDQFGWISLESVEVAVSPTFLVLSTLIAVAVLFLARRKRSDAAGAALLHHGPRVARPGLPNVQCADRAGRR